MKKIILTDFVKQIFETQSVDKSEWFGYYNYDTLNYDCSKMICNRASFDGISPQKGMSIEIGYYDIGTKNWKKIADTNSWNWQQGAMAQWLPTDDESEKVIFNDSENNRILSRIIDINSGQESKINWPIYGITPSGKHSISLEFERSRWCRAYHYASVDNYELEGGIIDSDGIFEVDLVHNTRKLIIPINDVIAIDPDDDFIQKKHWLEHIMVSPSGKRICFLHRFSNLDNIYSYRTRLCIANIDGSGMQVIPNWRDLTWTHFGWKSDSEFAIYTYTKPRWHSSQGLRASLNISNINIKDIVKALYCSVSSRLPYPLNYLLNENRSYYQLYKVDDTGQFKLSEEWQRKYFCIDGHPSFTNDSRYMITDSYPDNKGYQRLIVFDTITRKGVIIAKFFAYYQNKPSSCDLHPKLSKNNNLLVVDTAYDERHHMILFELEWEKIKNVISV